MALDYAKLKEVRATVRQAQKQLKAAIASAGSLTYAEETRLLDMGGSVEALEGVLEDMNVLIYGDA